MVSQNPEPEQAALRWAVAWERQIILEILRDAEPSREVAVLSQRLQQREIRNVRPAFPSPLQLATQAACRCWPSDVSGPAPSRTIELQSRIASAVEQELNESMAVLNTHGPIALSERLELLIEPEILFRSPHGDLVESSDGAGLWGMWYPGLDNELVSMQTALDTLPGVQEGGIPKEVRLFEDPKSTIALPGAVSLAWHDAIHILLGRGLLDQDEAFVVGFTMGNSSSFRNEDAVTLRNAFSHLYPEPFRVHGKKLLAFDLGIEAGRSIGVPDLAMREGHLSNASPLGQWRDQLGIDTESLRGFYARESVMIPRTLESARLPIGIVNRS
jgi:hypothetical protein